MVEKLIKFFKMSSSSKLDVFLAFTKFGVLISLNDSHEI